MRASSDGWHCTSRRRATPGRCRSWYRSAGRRGTLPGSDSPHPNPECGTCGRRRTAAGCDARCRAPRRHRRAWTGGTRAEQLPRAPEPTARGVAAPSSRFFEKRRALHRSCSVQARRRFPRLPDLWTAERWILDPSHVTTFPAGRRLSLTKALSPRTNARRVKPTSIYSLFRDVWRSSHEQPLRCYPPPPMNADQTRRLVDETWSSSIVPALEQYIRIPNQSPLFDPEWKKNGHMHRAVALARGWVEQQGIKGLTIEVHEIGDRTPLIFMEIEGDPSSTVLMYGHLDKQPAMVGWENGLGPWTPVLRDGKLYGRGGADDGYAIFATIGSIRALQQRKIAHSRIVVLIECCEESGSLDLPAYIELLADRIGTPRLVICLDSGCGTYDQLWMTTSLRGSIVGNLTVEVLTEGVHSGDASGIVPSSFRVIRMLLDRLEDAATGEIIPDWLHTDVPANRIDE